jgi:hypothetical protein
MQRLECASLPFTASATAVVLCGDWMECPLGVSYRFVE